MSSWLNASLFSYYFITICGDMHINLKLVIENLICVVYGYGQIDFLELVIQVLGINGKSVLTKAAFLQV